MSGILIAVSAAAMALSSSATTVQSGLKAIRHISLMGTSISPLAKAGSSSSAGFARQRNGFARIMTAVTCPSLKLISATEP